MRNIKRKEISKKANCSVREAATSLMKFCTMLFRFCYINSIQSRLFKLLLAIVLGFTHSCFLTHGSLIVKLSDKNYTCNRNPVNHKHHLMYSLLVNFPGPITLLVMMPFFLC